MDASDILEHYRECRRGRYAAGIILAEQVMDDMMTAKTTITHDDIREHLYTAVICDALDTIGMREQSPRLKLPRMTGSNRLVGRCRTTLWEDIDYEDPKPYDLELKAVDSCQPGDVFIAAAGGSMRSGIWGELLTTAARNRGCVGAIVDGGVRDVQKIRQMSFPVFTRGTCIYDSRNRQRVIDRDVDVEIGGVVFRLGDLVVADEDGIVVIPESVEKGILRLAWEKVHAENQVREAIRNGMKAVAAWEKFGIL